jgi:Zn-dependent protease with chaperone function
MLYKYSAIICLITLAFATSCKTASYNVSNKDIRKILKDYEDPLPIYKGDASVFWDYIQQNNSALNKYIRDNSRLKYQAKNEMRNLLRTYRVKLPRPAIEDIEDMYFYCGSDYDRFIKRITVAPSRDINAYARADGIIVITDGMFDLLERGRDYDYMAQIKGVVAHEVAHIVLKHSEVHIFAKKKIQRKKQSEAALYAVLFGAAVGVAVGYGADAPSSESITNLGTSMEYLYDAQIEELKFEYNRIMEMEADIAACMFLEWIGEDPYSHIRALEKLRQISDTGIVTKYDEHPSLNFRISNLKRIFSY